MTQQNDKQEEAQELRDKRVQHYMVLLTAWINTKMEHDKTLLTLSAAAIGLLITVLTTKGAEESWLIWFYGFAFLGYLSTIIMTLVIFQKNSKYIENEINNQSTDDKHLERLDKLTFSAFSLATVAFIMIGIFSAVLQSNGDNKKPDADQKMAKDHEEIKRQLEDLKKSVSGLGNLAPIQIHNSYNSTQSQQRTNQNKEGAK